MERPVVSKAEMEAVLALDASQRYSHFIKRVVDWESAWGLWDDGWIMVTDEQDRRGLPLWPAREYVDVFEKPELLSAPRLIPLDELDHLLAHLHEDHVMVAVFPTSDQRGMMVDSLQVQANLRAENERYQ